MNTSFTKLNHRWNAHPNVPEPSVEVVGQDLSMKFLMNAYQFTRFKEGDVGVLRFSNCWRYRLGGTNDEGWYRGQCRFSGIAPAWGAFYEVKGDLRIESDPEAYEWVTLRSPSLKSRHFLFYLRDETFECDAESWSLAVGTETIDQQSWQVPGLLVP